MYVCCILYIVCDESIFAPYINMVPTGPRICRLPGCNKPCFVEGSKVHDYCGRTHAKEHGAMSSPKTQGGRWATTGKSTGNGRQNSGGTGFFSGEY